MHMEFKYFNPNPDASVFKSGKPKAWYRDDSSIRSICAATNNDWFTVFDALVNIARKNKDVMDSKNTINEYLIINNFDYKTYGKPAPGESRQTVSEFIDKHNTGTYILYLRDYYVCIKDGVQLNTHEIKNDSVYSYWKMK